VAVTGNGKIPIEQLWGEEKLDHFCRWWEAGEPIKRFQKEFKLSNGTVYAIAGRLDLAKRGDRNVKLKASTCLSCSRPFMSAGNHNRVCKACKSCGAWASGNDYEAMI